MRPDRHIDEDSASRLLQGLVHPDDAPPGYSAVADLLISAARLPLGPVDEDAAATTVSAMVEVIRDASPAPEISRRKSMLGKLLAGKTLAVVAVVGLTATGAAAATGSLPDQAQAVVSDAADHVGVNIPHPNRGKSADHQNKNGDEAPPAGDDDSGDPNKGMSDFVEQTKLNRADIEGPFGKVICAKASDGNCVHPDSENKGKGGGDDDTTPPATEGENQGRSDEHGKPATTPPSTPAGSIGTGAENSGQRVGPEGRGKHAEL